MFVSTYEDAGEVHALMGDAFAAVSSHPRASVAVGTERHVAAHTVRVEPVGVEIEVRTGETLFDAAWRAGYRWPTICYGQAQCTHCHVTVKDGERNTSPVVDLRERAAITRVARLRYRGEAPRVRLACRLTVTGDVTVEQREFRGERPGHLLRRAR